MSRLIFCEECREYHREDGQCKDEYTVNRLYDDKIVDTKEVPEFNHEAAALKYGRYYNGHKGNNCLLGRLIRVSVTSKKGERREFIVKGEINITCYSNEIAESK